MNKSLLDVLANINIERFKKIQKENLLFTINLFASYGQLCVTKKKTFASILQWNLFEPKLKSIIHSIEFSLNAFLQASFSKGWIPLFVFNQIDPKQSFSHIGHNQIATYKF